MSTALNRKHLRRLRTALRLLGYALETAGRKAPVEPPNTYRMRLNPKAVGVMVAGALLSGCTAPVRLANACRDHQHGVVRFNEQDCPAVICLPVDGGSAWVALEDACR